MVYTARIDLAQLKWVAIACGLAVVLIIVAVIIGQTGPDKEILLNYSAYNCANGSHDSPCMGGKEVGKEWSNQMDVTTRPLNKRWYCYIEPFPSSNATDIMDYQVAIHTRIFGRQSSDPEWKLLTNDTELSYLPCYDTVDPCLPFLLVYEPNILYEYYGLQVRFSNADGSDLTDLGDVIFTVGIDNPEFSTMALILKLMFLVLNIVAIAFHYFRLRGKQIYWQSWTDEQRLFVLVLIFMVGFNNPFFPLEYLAEGWFIVFLGAFLELVFTCIMFAFWFIITEKFRSDEGRISFTLLLKLGLVMVILYFLIGTIYFGITGEREYESPVYRITSDVTVETVFYILTTLFYVLNAVLLFALTLAIILRPSASGRLLLKARFAFFVIPTYFLVIAVLSGLLYGMLGPNERDTPSFVFYLFLYNIYVYLQLWGFWPIEVVLPGSVDSNSESTRMFIQATQPTYAVDEKEEDNKL